VDEEKGGRKENEGYVRLLLKPEIVKLKERRETHRTISCKEYKMTV
jgi:hypothetical protein